ncbi:MAG TPA: hypothetical protein VE988_13250 [Gemmataceae bacterium]|nr:hypothetical protein [Gemmataceae bacterium]
MVQLAAGTLKTLVRTHLQALHTSSWLSSHFRKNYQHPMAIDVKPESVIEVLSKAGIKFMLMGTHAVNVYREQARATQDVDVLVRTKDVAKAIKALSKAFPGLTINHTPVVARFVDPATEKVVLDVMKPNQGVLKIAFRYTRAVDQMHNVPDLEMTLVSKFAAMVSPNRRPDKKMIDGGDFMNVVMFNRQHIDLKKLRRLAEKVYRGAGKEILEMINTIDAGRTLEL